MANYIVDFYCHKLKLVIEVDGDIHGQENLRKRDEEREECLKGLRLTVIRLTNDDVFDRIEKVIERIKSFIV